MRKIIPYLLIIIAISCKKESPIEHPRLTIEPGAYYPVYPGSFWKYYSSYSNSFYTNQVDSVYKLHAFKSQEVNCFITDSVYVPYMNNVPIYGYNLVKHTYSIYSSNNSPADCKSLVPFLREEIGGLYSETATYRGAGRSYSVTAIIDTMTIRGKLYSNIIEVTFEEHNDFGTTTQESKTYYAKNVGLIKSITITNVWNPAFEGAFNELDTFNINH